MYKVFNILTTTTLLFFLMPLDALAQGINLSVAPSIIEVMIAPGKMAEQRYIVENLGEDTSLKVDISPFYSNDLYGNVSLMDPISLYDPQSISSWFTFTKPSFKNTKQVFLAKDQKMEFILRINPSEDAKEGDYYYTLVFETLPKEDANKDFVSGVKIGSNILLTVSKTGELTKKAAISSFKAPTLIDSFSPLTYEVVIQNTGSSFFKPQGNITITGINTSEVLPIAPFNVLASSKRVLPCFIKEQVIACKVSSKPLFGIYQSRLTFTIEGSSEIYSKTVTTIAFPILITLIIVIFITLWVLVRNRFKKPIDKESE